MTNEQHKGPKYFVDIEGTLKPWDEDTITTEQIIALAGWGKSQQVMLIDQDNQEHTLQSGEIIHLKPGMGFSKKIHFRRG